MVIKSISNYLIFSIYFLKIFLYKKTAHFNKTIAFGQLIFYPSSVDKKKNYKISEIQMKLKKKQVYCCEWIRSNKYKTEKHGKKE